MANRIRIEDLLLRELDRSLEMKNGLETKAVGYLAVISLLLTLFIQMWLELRKLVMCEQLSRICVVFFSTLFGIGTILLILCSLMLFPKRIDHIRFSELREIYNDPSDSDDSRILSIAEIAIQENERTLKIMDKLNHIVSIGLMLLLAGFVSTSVVYFVVMGGKL